MKVTNEVVYFEH